MNITDIDDKIIQGAAAEGITDRGSWPTATRTRFLADADALRHDPPDVLPRATEHIPQIVDAHRRRCSSAGTRTAPTTARSSSGSRPGPRTGGWRGSIPRRCASASASRPTSTARTTSATSRCGRAPSPASHRGTRPIGPGRPGLAHRVLRDEHGPPRSVVRHPHRRRRPRLPAPRGRDRPVRGRHRASRSCGPGSTARTSRWTARRWPSRPATSPAVGELVEAGVSPRALRYALLAVHYRAPLNFTDESLAAAGGRAWSGSTRCWRRSRPTARTAPTTRPSPALLDATRARVRGRRSTTTSTCRAALAALFDGVRELNRRIDARSLSTADAERAAALLRDLDAVLGRRCADAESRSTPSCQALLDARAAARAARDWAASDRLRDELLARGRRRRGHARRPALAASWRPPVADRPPPGDDGRSGRALEAADGPPRPVGRGRPQARRALEVRRPAPRGPSRPAATGRGLGLHADAEPDRRPARPDGRDAPRSGGSTAGGPPVARSGQAVGRRPAAARPRPPARAARAATAPADRPVPVARPASGPRIVAAATRRHRRRPWPRPATGGGPRVPIDRPARCDGPGQHRSGPRGLRPAPSGPRRPGRQATGRRDPARAARSGPPGSVRPTVSTADARVRPAAPAVRSPAAAVRPPAAAVRTGAPRPPAPAAATPRPREPIAPRLTLAEDEELVAGRRPGRGGVRRRVARPRRLLVVPQRRQALEKLVLHATSLRIPVVEVEGGTLTSVAGFDGHQGIALVVGPRRGRRPTRSSPSPPSGASRRSCWSSTRSRTPRTSARCCAAPRPRACTAPSSRPVARRR